MTAPHPTSLDAAAVPSPRAFKDLFRHHPAGVAIVTLVGPDGAPVGFTATSVISVSASPAVLAFSITGVSSSWPALREAHSAVVSFLAHDQADLSVRFATPGIDRFTDTPLEWLPTGEPRLAQVTSWARVEIAERIPAGSSFLVTADVTHVHEETPHAQVEQPRLVYVDRTYHRTGGHSQVG
ncbi:flavin oxidoreductase [Serinibacter arcticus]|uniref:Flavin oxidoreductase n=1 Tax=Serinibacter arcticus TaxID=1655435 RepID=A0A2U1ZR50_9MICO|nr:flavin reductase family protein [Serinibacter arcticus]PWD49421.1 flavin oxidoreductase [Serinibacter arcticus]